MVMPSLFLATVVFECDLTLHVHEPPQRIIHHVIDSSDWPSPVKRITRALGRPLPTYIHTGPHPFVSTNASSILRELSCGEFRRVSGENLLNSDEKWLNDVFDIVLTVSELRELAKWNDNGQWISTPNRPNMVYYD